MLRRWDGRSIIHPGLVLFEQAHCIDWNNFCYILSLTEIIDLSGNPVTCFMLSFGNLVVNPVQFLLTENIKGGIKG